MQRTCGEFSCWKVRGDYVSFDIEAQGSEVVVKNAGFRVITDTFLGTFLDFRRIESIEGTTTAQDISASISEEDTVELHRFARLMIEGKPTISVVQVVLDAIPDHLDDNLKSEALTKFSKFVKDIGNTLNNKENSWIIKAEAVDELQTFVLAVHQDSFSFLNAEFVQGEETKRLTNDEIL